MGNSEIIIKYIKDYRKDYKVYALFYNDNKENKMIMIVDYLLMWLKLDLKI